MPLTVRTQSFNQHHLWLTFGKELWRGKWRWTGNWPLRLAVCSLYAASLAQWSWLAASFTCPQLPTAPARNYRTSERALCCSALLHTLWCIHTITLPDVYESAVPSPCRLDSHKLSAIALEVIIKGHSFRNYLQNDGLLQQEHMTVSQYLFIPDDVNWAEGTRRWAVKLTAIVRPWVTRIKVPVSQRKASKVLQSS